MERAKNSVPNKRQKLWRTAVQQLEYDEYEEYVRTSWNEENSESDASVWKMFTKGQNLKPKFSLMLKRSKTFHSKKYMT